MLGAATRYVPTNRAHRMHSSIGACTRMSSLLPLLLASASPRRRQIISTLGLAFTVGVSPTNEEAMESAYPGPIDGLAQWLAAHKALMMLMQPEAANQLIVTADTTVLLDDQALGKPRDSEHARELLL